MGLRIQNNIAAMNAHRQLTITDAGLSKSLERLSSGYRINKAADDAAGLAISQSFRADIASYRVASRNVSEANALVQVAEGAYDQIGSMLIRMKELATQAASSNAGSNLDKINDEGNVLLNEIDRIANVTEYAGTKLLNGTFGVTASSSGTFTASTGFQSVTGLQESQTYSLTVTTTSTAGEYNVTVAGTVGSVGMSQTINNVAAPGTGETSEVSFDALGLTITVNDNFSNSATGETIISNAGTASNFQVGSKDSSNDRIGINLDGVTTSDLSISSDQMLTAENAQTFLTSIDAAIDTLNNARGGLGSIQNRLSYAASNLSTTIENVQAAESVIRDVDMAAEMTAFTKNQILLQAGTAMLAQANMSPQSVLSLLG
ncbi:flagellin [Deltaproteobacteria bacterium]|nr:flagellin [Deltaproteobacteria bacterium]